MISSSFRNNLFFDHIVLVVRDIARTKAFYEAILWLCDESDDESILFRIGRTKLFFVLPRGELPEDDRFSANRIGLEHLAFGIETLVELQEIEKILNDAGIVHSWIHVDTHSSKEKIRLDDPDGMRIEFYIAN